MAVPMPGQWQLWVESDHHGYERLIAFRQFIDALSGPIEFIGKKRLLAWRSWSLE
jgi:hypothetical protein